MESYELELDWRGFELHPETPPEGIPLGRFFDPSRIPEMHDYLRRFAAGFEVEIQPPLFLPNTRTAMAIAEWARDEGVLEAFRNRAMDAYWLSGKDLGKLDVLVDLATDAGLDPRRVPDVAIDAGYLGRVDGMREEATRVGIRGIPTFLLRDRMIVGCQPYQTLADAADGAGVPHR